MFEMGFYRTTGERGVKLSVGVEIAVYGDQQLQITNFASTLGRSQVGNPVITNIE